MKKKLIISIVTLIVLYSCSSLIEKKIQNLPLASDAYWNNLSNEWIKNKNKDLETNLSFLHPKLLTQINQDSKDPYLLMFWGKSSNRDANNNKIIVDEDILTQLHQKFNIYSTEVNAHAGVIHTYGYLFSQLETPYGFKRKRWIDQSLNYAFSLKNLSLSTETVEGGLLSNLTYFIGMITLKNKTNLQLLKNVSPEIQRYDYDGLKTYHLEESTKEVIIRTTFVRFSKTLPKEDNSYLLIYSIFNLALDKEFLITAFPVNQKFFLDAQEKENLGKNKKIRLRYNAVLENFPEKALGTRTFLGR